MSLSNARHDAPIPSWLASASKDADDHLWKSRPSPSAFLQSTGSVHLFSTAFCSKGMDPADVGRRLISMPWCYRYAEDIIPCTHHKFDRRRAGFRTTRGGERKLHMMASASCISCRRSWGSYEVTIYCRISEHSTRLVTSAWPSVHTRFDEGTSVRECLAPFTDTAG